MQATNERHELRPGPAGPGPVGLLIRVLLGATPGGHLHETAKGGNELLRLSFEWLHADPPRRDLIPPFFVFAKAGTGRDARFLGLAVPGAAHVQPSDDLVAIWRAAAGRRFQNYRATFTILDVGMVPRAWISDIMRGAPLSEACPRAFAVWARSGKYTPLCAPRTVQYRDRAAQVPDSATGQAVIKAIYQHFKQDPYGFERCAAQLWQMLSTDSVTAWELTRPSWDGGRDAVGQYTIGPWSDPIHIDFALEAKCLSLQAGVGVKATSRLISRLRHRQFGVFVTTSFVHRQAYKELRDDGHPVVVLCARDIVDILRHHGISTVAATKTWLLREFPMSTDGARAGGSEQHSR
jgi:Restriction endonuclease AspBHI N-terminal/Restriction endonuclease